MHRSFRTWIVVLALSFTPAFAQDTAQLTARDKVAKILDLQFSKQAYTAVIENYVPVVINSARLKNPSLTPAQIKQITDIYKNTVVEMRSSVVDATIDGWLETYSEEEIDALYKFYTSPVGSAIAAKQAALSQSTQSKNRMVNQTIVNPELIRRMKSDPILKDVAF